MSALTSRRTIAFFDSGVGGLPYLEQATVFLPHAVMHYIADDAGFPYGNKPPREVEELLLDRTRRLRARLMPDALVIACNTASQIGLKILRRAHPDLSIIGTVPAIKPAAETSRTGHIGVIATERTVSDPYIDDLITRYASAVEVVKLPAQDLVTFVERRYLAAGAEERRSAVEPYVRTFIDRGVDRIILACTHFLHLEKDIAACASSMGAQDVEIVDSRLGVAKRLAQIIAEMDEGTKPREEARSGKLRPESSLGGASPGTRGRFLLTGDPPFDASYDIWAERFGLLPPERL